MLSHVFIVAVQQKMQFAARALQPRAIEPAKRTCTDDRITSLHGPKLSKTQLCLLCLRGVVLEARRVPHPKLLRVRALLTYGVCAAVCVGVDGGGGKG